MAQGTDAKVEIVQLLAIFHDSRRINEGTDDDHGRRGAELAAKLRGDLFGLTDEDFELLQFACRHHTDGLVEADMTIQLCWDADRLDLGRVGIVPVPKKLCTPTAKQPSVIKWADGRAAFEIVPDLVKAEWGIELRQR